jgi:hypothetical protein
MIFAALDYWAFRRKRRQYDVTRSGNQLSSLFEGSIPSEVATKLEQGDVVFTSNLRSGLSWIIRYLTGSQLTHVVIVTGPGTVMDTTLSGVAIRPLNELYAEQIRFAPMHSPLTESERVSEGLGFRALPYLGKPYAKLEVMKIAVGALLNYYPRFFRMAFVADMFIFLLTLDLINIELFKYPILIWLEIPYLIVVIYFFLTWRFFGRSVTEPIIPDSLLQALKERGWTVFLSGRAIQESLRRSRGIEVDLPEVVEFRS